MGETTGIAWTDATVNFWWGCTKVSAGCANCYAETWSARTGKAKWGPGEPRTKIAGAVLLAHKLQRKAKAEGRRIRVFTNSMSDFFDAEVDPEWRAEAIETIKACPDLDWLLVTKRPENIGAMMPFRPLNVWLGVTAEDQPNADKRISELLRHGAIVHFVSYEPALGPVDFTRWLGDIGDLGAWTGVGGPRLDWIIVGGESGHGARPFDLAWARATVAACKAAGVACFVKQLGKEPRIATDGSEPSPEAGDSMPNVEWDDYVRAGPSPDGRQWWAFPMCDKKGSVTVEWPEDLRVQEWPR